MKKQVSIKPKPTLTLLLTVIALELLSLLAFINIDKIVHGDLYSYGLKFSYEWAEQYWTNSHLIINCLLISILLTAIALISILLYSKTQKTTSKIIAYTIFHVFLISGTTIMIFSLYPFSRLDYIIHHDLYSYGLKFSYEWAANYWIYARLMLSLISFASAITVISIVLVFVSAQKILKMHPLKLISSILVALATIAMAISIIYSSQILAFIGLGLTFWSVIFALIRTEDYIRRKLMDATSLAPLGTLNQVLKELDYKGKAIYLPPKYLKNQEENKAYIPKQKENSIPSPEILQQQEDRLFIEKPNGILLTPPGNELTKFFERTLGTSFTRVDLKYLQVNMPELFVEDLQIAQTMDITTEENQIYVKIENSIYQYLSKEVAQFSPLYASIGCPLSSAIACALAKATGKPILIEKQQIKEKIKSIEIQYRIIEEEQNTQ